MKRSSPVHPAAGKILIVYGNASWTVGCAHYANEIQEVAPYDVYLLEYPGYADRQGNPSQARAFSAADEAFRLLSTNNQPVYILGESLGTGVASYLAGTYTNQVAGIMLLSPFNRLTGVAQYRMPYLPAWLLLVDRFPSETYLCRYHGPLGVMVDAQDRVVPEKFGRQLYDSYKGPKQLWRFPAGRHIEIDAPHDRFWREVFDFWRNGTAPAG